MKRRVMLLAVSITLLWAHGAHAQSVATLWKARGLEASERIGRSRNESQPQDVQLLRELLEQAYALHVHPSATSVVHKAEAGGEVFHIILKSEDGDFFDLAYTYDKGGAPAGCRVDRIPRGWRLMFVNALKEGLLLDIPERGPIVFLFAKPLEAFPLGEKTDVR
jgi:hypothetical protein